MLARDWDERPEPYNGVQMRSKLEVRCARFLDQLSVPWEYEVPVEIDGRRIPYLPDFHIDARNPHGVSLLEIGWGYAPWIEVKPQEFIYLLRDHLGVAERSNEFVEVSAKELRADDIEELWKPKRLAEITDNDVLVVGQVDKDRTLSATMTPEGVNFRIDHPFVNYRGVTKRREKDRQRAVLARQEEERRRQREQEAEQREAERKVRRAARLRELGATSFVGSRKEHARFLGMCWICEAFAEPAELWVYFWPQQPYRIVCATCDIDAQALRKAAV